MPSQNTRSNDHPRRSVTSVDVARAAGVSQTTVSLVVSGKAAGRISEETQLLVRKTAAELGYVPNTSARVLRGGTPRAIALAVPNVRHEYFGQVLLAAEFAARERAMALMLVDTASDPGWVDRLIMMNNAHRLAGAIIYAEGPQTVKRLSQAIDHLVFVECGVGPRLPAIDLDIAGGMQQVVEHLYDLGHRRIGHAQASNERETFQLRAFHLQESLSARGIHFDPSWHYRSSFDYADATPAALDFLRTTDVTAVFCDDDIIAANLYRACRQLSIQVPADLSIVGFNDVDLTRYLHPELTSIAIPATDVGEQAVRTLLGLLKGTGHKSRLIPLRLRVRQSTSKPRPIPPDAVADL